MKMEIIYTDEDGSHTLLLPTWVVDSVVKSLAKINKLVISLKLK